MSRLKQLASVRNKNISVAEWGARIDRGLVQPRLEPMKPVSGRHAAIRHDLPQPAKRKRAAHSIPTAERSSVHSTATTTGEDTFAEWIRDIGETGQTTEQSLTTSRHDVDVDLEDLFSTAEMEAITTPPTITTATVTAPTEPALSVNEPDSHDDTIRFHLSNLNLTSDASWAQITSRYTELLNSLENDQDPLSSSAARHRTTRREINTSYACLRLLAVKNPGSHNDSRSTSIVERSS